MLEARGEGIVVWTLRFGDEVRPESEYFTGIDKKSDPKGVSALEAVVKKTAEGLVAGNGVRPDPGKLAEADSG